MSIEDAMMGGIIFKGKKEKPKEENKIKTKAKKKDVYHRAARLGSGQDESRNQEEKSQQA